MKKLLAVLLCLLLAAGLFACRELPQTDDEENERPLAGLGEPLTTAAPAATLPDPAPVTLPPLTKIADEDLIFELDYGDAESAQAYRVPQLKLTGGDAEAINEQIRGSFGALASQALENLEQGLSPIYYSVDWRVVWYEDIFALIVATHADNDCSFYNVYNVRGDSCALVSNAELLQRVGLSEEAFLHTAIERAEQVFAQTYPYAPLDEHYRDRLQFSRDQISLDTKMYLDPEQGLTLISPLGSLAGADSYQTIFPLAMPKTLSREASG